MKKDKHPRIDLLKQRIREHKGVFALYVVLRMLVLLTMVFQLLNGNYENVFLCLLTLVLFLLPSFVEVNFHIELPDALEIVVLLFVFAAEILGEIQSFYTIYPHWDLILHTANGFLAAAIGFSMVDLLNRSDRFSFSLSPFFTALVAFCFSMTIAVMWEFFEFAADSLFAIDMQKDSVITQINSVALDPAGLNRVVHMPVESVIVNGQDWTALYGGYLDIGLLDTMEDMFVNFIGAIVFSVIGFFYTKTRGKGKIAKHFIPKPSSKKEGGEKEFSSF